MSAGIRIYDPDTGLVTLDTTEGITRIVRTVSDATTSGSITIPANVVGGGSLFWYGVGQAAWKGGTFATISGNTISYVKKANHTLIIGVYT